MPRREPLTPEAERELEALDRALAGEPVGDPDLADLALLVDAVRADAPKMTPQFAARMEEELEQGFPAAKRRRRLLPALPKLPRLHVMAPAAGALAAAVIALVVVLGNSGGTQGGLFSGESVPAVSDSGGSTDAGGLAPAQEDAPTAAAEPERRSLDRAARSAPSTSPVPADRIAPNREDRKVERSAELALDAPDGELQDVADDVIRTTDRFKGIVAASSIDSSGERGEARFDLRVPTDQLDEALAAYSELADVSSRSQDLTDITGSFVSAEDRLSDARSERRGLLRALGRAESEREVRSLRARLRTVRGTIGRLNGELNALRRRADLATVALTVRADGRAGASEEDEGGPWTPGDAAGDAGRVLEVAAGVALIALAVAVPLGLVGAPALIGARTARRRRREAALDAG